MAMRLRMRLLGREDESPLRRSHRRRSSRRRRHPFALPRVSQSVCQLSSAASERRGLLLSGVRVGMTPLAQPTRAPVQERLTSCEATLTRNARLCNPEHTVTLAPSHTAVGAKRLRAIS